MNTQRMNATNEMPIVRISVIAIWLCMNLLLLFLFHVPIYSMDLDESGHIYDSDQCVHKNRLAETDNDGRLNLDDVSAKVHLVRTRYPNEWGIPRPAGLAYSYDLAYIYLLNKEETAQSSNAAATVVTITPYEDEIDTADVDFDVDVAINIAFDDVHKRLFLLNQSNAELAQVESGGDGILDPTALDIFDITQLGLMNAQGMDIDALGERLFILDRATDEIVSMMLDANGRLESTEVVRIDIGHLDADDLRGIAVHPLDGHLHVVSQAKETLFELTQSGQLVRSYDLAAIDLTDPGGLAFMPSADLTDPPGVIHLLVAESKLIEQLNAVYLPRIEQTTINHAPSQTDDHAIVVGHGGQLLGEILELALEN